MVNCHRIAILAAATAFAAQGAAPAGDAAARGEYLTAAAGCVACHTVPDEGAPRFAGGRALKTPFGTFYSPNITPDPDTGIGRWSPDEFVRALQEGIGPGGKHYFPAFPYTSYAGMSRADVLAIRAYLGSLPPVHQPNRPHELAWYVDTRLAAAAWQLLFFRPAPFAPDTARGAEWNRGAYLVRHLGHCGECHTPRNALGVTDATRELAGTAAGPEGKKVPSIRADAKGLADWSTDDLETFLETGMKPDGDFVGAGMGEVVTENTGRLTPADRHAIVTYLRTVGAPGH